MISAEAIKPLVEALKAELLPIVRDQVLAEVRAELAGREPADGKIMLSLADLAGRYGCGRTEALRLIEDGQLPSVQRRCRGGKLGNFIHITDAERVLGGRRSR